jgi:tripartite-type tricarboxylate transporter receptor subunit TctC
MPTRRSLLGAPLLAAAPAAWLAAWLAPWRAMAAAGDLPAGTITIIVSFPAGGSTDAVIRAIAAKMQARLGRPVIVENRAGAAGALATAFVAKANADGLTLLASPSSLAANPTLFKSLPFDTLKDLQAVSYVFGTPLVLVVNAQLPVRSIAELIALLKQKPGTLNYAHGGPGSAIQLAAEMFQAMTGTRMNGVAYRGAPLALNDVIAGHVALMFADVGSVTALLQGGQIRALGVTSTERVPVMPDVPTVAEVVPGFDAVGWSMIAAPSATPRPVIDLLAKELSDATQEPDVQTLIEKLGALPVKSPSPAELQKFLASEIARWGALIERTGAAKSQ